MGMPSDGRGNVDTRWFQGVLQDKRLSQRQLAKLMGLDPGAVSLMLRGKRRMSATEVAEIARLLGVRVDEVMVHLGVDGHGVRGKARADGAVAGPTLDKARDVAPAQGNGSDWEAEFMRKWLDLGFMLLRNRGPV